MPTRPARKRATCIALRFLPYLLISAAATLFVPAVGAMVQSAWNKGDKVWRRIGTHATREHRLTATIIVVSHSRSEQVPALPSMLLTYADAAGVDHMSVPQDGSGDSQQIKTVYLLTGWPFRSFYGYESVDGAAVVLRSGVWGSISDATAGRGIALAYKPVWSNVVANMAVFAGGLYLLNIGLMRAKWSGRGGVEPH